MEDSKVLQQLLSDPRVKSIDAMGESKSSATLVLKRGFIDTESSMHVMTGTPSQFLRRIKYVEPCECWQCQPDKPKRFCGNRNEGCGASLTEVNINLGYCSQCGYSTVAPEPPLEQQLLQSITEIQSQRDAEVA